jgi:hypothetical protein
MDNLRALGKTDYALRQFLRHCYEQKNSEYHASDYVVMTRARYQSIMDKLHPKPKIRTVYMDKATDYKGEFNG